MENKKTIENLLKGLAHSNFYLKFEEFTVEDYIKLQATR